ncbi:tRNA (adenosine(37)-N6)-threonylcarbamoyltransferase complex dimerization subunit type 1 TsaB [Candidatus Blochmannia ocreatus (nom. nud.)]|uniref:tRNA threonylcarbamoyladenosine biosynthesis protein TsaB n=1 Tax=Candidatus Blochmannia ocreatus (nom. nud.) TaxID=251538 RepID=A0ABY4SST2_9ENTR|nr:tRNA (adenosine(37)-N6)-threonylcarbamoyltransferase complex dimerization subunit type 1 TsaB [Candidatus Blochmannia ocreatus]URJ24941.1 tRNA (adenosine(37)-N6)-threonylcarbamoyltransferase complex dimerization subunit type 1 TsaB [Candidatus Blochmannia ocreatus]
MPIRILAFDTTTDLCSVALMINNHIYSNKVIAARKHAEKILCMIDTLLIEVGINLKSLDCIIFNRGPGSFVGVRVGISVAQGLALGADLPLVAVSSLEVLAQGAFRIFSTKHVISVIDAQMGELYWAYYYKLSDCNCWVSYINEFRSKAEFIAEKLLFFGNLFLGNWGFVGTGWNKYLVLQEINACNEFILKRSIMYPEAQDMLLVGMCSWKNKRFITPYQVRPVYLRDLNIIKK